MRGGVNRAGCCEEGERQVRVTGAYLGSCLQIFRIHNFLEVGGRVLQAKNVVESKLVNRT